jgi:hypothetical protein
MLYERDYRFSTDYSRSVSQCGSYVVLRDIRVVLKNLLRARALGHAFDDGIHRYPRAAYHGLARHDAWVNDYSVRAPP